jgi:hypothetical protein
LELELLLYLAIPSNLKNNVHIVGLLMRVEIKNYQDDSGEICRGIFVEGELFDWGLDEADLKTAKTLIRQEPLMRKSVMGDIQSHFVACFSEFIGQEVTLSQINEALRTGEL